MPAEMAVTLETAQEAVYPQVFSNLHPAEAARVYQSDPCVAKLVEFFESKGLCALKQEDRNEQWYGDWLAYQREHHLYGDLLAPQEFSSRGGRGGGFDLLRVTRFLEVFGYFSPAHGYSLQVTFLGFFSILMGSNAALKREAVAALEAGELLAFAISEKEHGADLLGNEFRIREVSSGRLRADGKKYYIGNCNCAAIITTLARNESGRAGGGGRRAPVVLVALRPKQSTGLANVRKISTLGVRAAFVGEFEVKDFELTPQDVIAEGRDAWDAIFGTITLGKFFLGFGSIGICEHAFAEATDHLSRRMLYGKPVIEMPHIRSLLTQAYARLLAMKLYAYRAIDYVQAASADDRRYLLFTTVQKAKVSTEGVKVISLLSECIGAKAFESDTFFEMALRDIQLIPSLEGSTHVNLALAAQFIPRYFQKPDDELLPPKSLIAGEASSDENPYLMNARRGGIGAIGFNHFLAAYKPLSSVPNIRLFARQAKAFELFIRDDQSPPADGDTKAALSNANCLATIAYAQLIAENVVLSKIPTPFVSAIFHLLMLDLAACGMTLAASSQQAASKRLAGRMALIPQTSSSDWDFVAQRIAGTARIRAGGGAGA
jgi:acyl-CoA dehydrogenase